MKANGLEIRPIVEAVLLALADMRGEPVSMFFHHQRFGLILV